MLIVPLRLCCVLLRHKEVYHAQGSFFISELSLSLSLPHFKQGFWSVDLGRLVQCRKKGAQQSTQLFSYKIDKLNIFS